VRAVAAAALVAGIDEAGRGPLAGPVVAAAVILPPGAQLPGLGDSKTVTPRTRAALEKEIKKCCIACAVGRADVAEIDRLNILNATLLAMRRALLALPVAPAEAWVDGNRAPLLPCPARCFVRGDARFAVISAASILAKECRDREMRDLHRRWPQYNFAANKGYGSRAHRRALSEHGPCPAHRRSFAPLRLMLARGAC